MVVSMISILVISYLIGSIHGSKLAQYLSGVNIKKEGLKNSGASNAAIVLGAKYGVLVAIIDILKGVIVVIGTRFLVLKYTDFTLVEQDILLYSVGAAVILGHNFPIYTKFKGGKGTATLIGVLLALSWPLGLIGLILLIGTTFLTDYLLIGVFVFYFVFIGASIWFAEGIGPMAIAGFLFLMAVVLHIENFRRLMRKEEMKISTFLSKKKPSV
ncbi:glycerol-3-phosphate acyltransferase [Psychrobacillus psychrodurans]|jgi:glycerol-3-phosphate acyltransferase PlsY|uniref:Glycerol-3-phosphate acyltransferase n=1 Tax=Psychrobacillus psychrodurans TaxID=126157 RepID=A0A9X3LB46_9BACI|nr:glycerol-3-phosphate acyltransferase [Psychrobacillus psychrodurans]MCK1999457.1 glycerol-3-phosphate acyltransferase [Psychrobacillus psychrodurans]MCZ8534658.1 glycerol-3-phosphate acyltransferase [Psychrobacillus psychrodurans]MCZ8540781.1 glycerol-3-phosphate acyltransferase [Psychrobacillus psychrodurans]SFM75356.1 glycerol-3-phosphate acyltransferase PlsY [Psychrobacillus psychrodurans]